jgi:hypothetical protein
MNQFMKQLSGMRISFRPLRGSQAAFSCFGSRRKSRFGARPGGATLRIEKSKRSGSWGEAYQNFEDRCEEWGE